MVLYGPTAEGRQACLRPFLLVIYAEVLVAVPALRGGDIIPWQYTLQPA